MNARTFHVHTLFLAERRAQFLNPRREAALYVLRRKLLMSRLALLGRRERVLRYRSYPLDQCVALAEVLRTERQQSRRGQWRVIARKSDSPSYLRDFGRRGLDLPLLRRPVREPG